MYSNSNIDKTIFNLVKNMNRHVPTRRTLKELLGDEKPSVTGRDGKKQSISREELRLLSDIVPRDGWSRVRLPILIEMTNEFENTAARVQGQIECEIIRSVLGMSKPGNNIVLYLPELQYLRRKLPTTTQYIFYIKS